MLIRITKAGLLVKKIGIEEETAIVGEVSEVSDEFIKRLDVEFPHVAYERVQPDADELALDHVEDNTDEDKNA